MVEGASKLLEYLLQKNAQLLNSRRFTFKMFAHHPVYPKWG
jgi:hypothetical protein